MKRFLSVLGVVTLAATINLQAQYIFTTLSVPGAIQTRAWGISGNNIVGYYTGFTGTYGFLYNGSSYTTLSVPGAVTTWAQGISGNDIVGYYKSGTGSMNGFLYDGSSYTTLSVPGAAQTQALGIDGNYIVGNYTSSTGTYGFVYDGSS
jgi:hypothetical protein